MLTLAQRSQAWDKSEIDMTPAERAYIRSEREYDVHDIQQERIREWKMKEKNPTFKMAKKKDELRLRRDDHNWDRASSDDDSAPVPLELPNDNSQENTVHHCQSSQASFPQSGRPCLPRTEESDPSEDRWKYHARHNLDSEDHRQLDSVSALLSTSGREGDGTNHDYEVRRDYSYDASVRNGDGTNRERKRVLNSLQSNTSYIQSVAGTRDELHVGLDIPKQAATEVYNWVQEQDWPKGTELEPLESYHITVLFAQGDGAGEHNEDEWISHDSHAVTTKRLKEFPPSKERDGLHPIVLILESDTIHAHHNALAEGALEAGVDPGPYSRGDYVPHMTIGYGPELPKGLKVPKMTFETAESTVSTPREEDETHKASFAVVNDLFVFSGVGEPPKVTPESTDGNTEQEPHPSRIAGFMGELVRFSDSWNPKDQWPNALRERNGEPVDAECTCKDGHKLDCPVHGMHPTLPTYDDTLEFPNPASPVGYDYHADGPRTWMRAETKTKRKLWLDDTRKPPDEDWDWARNVAEATALAKQNDYKHMSLDHDLGILKYEGKVVVNPDALDGGDFVIWLHEHKKHMPKSVNIHSHNKGAVKLMVEALEPHAKMTTDRAPDDLEEDWARDFKVHEPSEIKKEEIHLPEHTGSHQLAWLPGSHTPGKGLVTPSGDVHTWPVDKDGMPHHAEYVDTHVPYQLGEGQAHFFKIRPRGGLDTQGYNIPANIINHILTTLPGLHEGESTDWHFAADNVDTREYQDSRMMPPMNEAPGATNPHPEKQGCTCQEGHKLDCPVHGLEPVEKGYDHSWSIPEGSPVNFPDAQPRNYMKNEGSKNDARNSDNKQRDVDYSPALLPLPNDNFGLYRDHRYRFDPANIQDQAFHPYLLGSSRNYSNEDQRRSPAPHNRDSRDDWRWNNDVEMTPMSDREDAWKVHASLSDHDADSRRIEYDLAVEHNPENVFAFRNRTDTSRFDHDQHRLGRRSLSQSGDQTLFQVQSSVDADDPWPKSSTQQDQPRNYIKAEGGVSSGNQSREQDNTDAHESPDENGTKREAQEGREGDKEQRGGVDHDPTVADCSCSACKARDTGWAMTGLPRAEGAIGFEDEEDEHEDNLQGDGVQVPEPPEQVKRKQRERKDRELVDESLLHSGAWQTLRRSSVVI